MTLLLLLGEYYVSMYECRHACRHVYPFNAYRPIFIVIKLLCVVSIFVANVGHKHAMKMNGMGTVVAKCALQNAKVFLSC